MIGKSRFQMRIVILGAQRGLVSQESAGRLLELQQLLQLGSLCIAVFITQFDQITCEVGVK